ncbi:hypothetical protein OG2516_13801 [Oceanicola granulosus HTCC2516]|uniref:SH3b domain-containing protein n=1 Tax=Oceanicola granulosus (strain ATCC BAA-861 / DSM 15982 / KCTC 12143 / HTCC2516) TaxID=314256 RepID=Q2CA79_OCEGH|nr:DUF1236 domain-containing protein [Oceanicola granulosus]EAR49566.1 hypothetical protein OG2516_13801 [Oceanicola granulosus HTCC2516]
MKTRTLLTASAIALVTAAPVMAAPFEAGVITDLNIRSGPGPDFEVVGVIPEDGNVTVEGCLENGNWCEVTYDGTTGWSYDQYLAVEAEAEAEERVIVAQRPASVEVETLTYEREATDTEQSVGAGAGATLGALSAYALGGPAAGIVASGIFGAAAGAEATDEVEETVTYVRENPVETIYLDGEVVVGAAVPDSVTMYDLPQVDGYQYLTVNQVPVIVDAETGVIVRAIR